MLFRPVHAALAAVALLSQPVAARAPAAKPASAGFHGVVSAADPRAAAAGAAMLRAGGSATDAAIATMLALGVVEPQSSGIGGGGFLVTAGADGHVDSFDGREAAPAAADAQWFVRDGHALDHGEAIPGGRSVGVPGNLALAALAHARHGRLPWARLFAPAIRLARDGYAMTPRLNASVASMKSSAGFDPAGRALWFDAAGAALPVGTVIHNPALAKILTQVAQLGPRAFYSGANAAALARHVRTSPINPAPMTVTDIGRYHARTAEPVCAPYRTWKVCSMGPPSAGGIAVLQVMGMLQRFDLAALGPASPVAWHLVAEAERLAFADRDRFVADPGFVQVPTKGLLDPGYISARSALISAGSTMPVVAPGTPAGAVMAYASANPVDEHGTTHFVAVDARGDVASYTSTVESGFGSGLIVNGYVLNNELTDFNFASDSGGKETANQIGPNKRPRSSMSPVVVYDSAGNIRLATGAAGGLTIPVQVVRVLIGTLDWGQDARTAIAQGVVMPYGGALVVESGTALEPMIPALVALGHAKVVAMPMRLKANAVEHTPDGWRGAADPRSEGASVAP
ncbi:gamma-glutamyltransferase family protein [Novosphingobium sp.]|uniref:gamma-glutamyltransferase family protein n=1 Tax=Novosphingobium sp. TaxID=1874826 RepID=UPI003340A483